MVVKRIISFIARVDEKVVKTLCLQVEFLFIFLISNTNFIEKSFHIRLYLHP